MRADRRRTSRLAWLCIGACASLVFAAPAFADEAAAAAPGVSAAAEEPSVFAEAAEPLGLTPEQVSTLERLSTESHEHASMLRAERRALQGELNTLLKEDDPSIDEVMDYAERLGVLDTRIRKHHLASLLAVRAVLTKQQRNDILPVFKQINDRRRAAREHAETASAKAETPAAAAPDGS